MRIIFPICSLLTGCSLLGDNKGGDPFHIELRYVDWTPTADEEADFQAAVDRWEQVMTEGLPDAPVTITQADINALPEAEGCAPIDETVDDLVVFVRSQEMQNPLAMAAVCGIDFSGHQLPVVSRMIVGHRILDGGDQVDKRTSSLKHELGHALGLTPVTWNIDLDSDGTPDRSLLPGHTGTCPLNSALTFTGTQANAAYQALGGTGQVPMEPGATASGDVDGSGCVHLSEAVFDDALMSPRQGSSPTLLTPVTLGMLADIGYPVDMNAADPYVLPALREPIDTGQGDSGTRSSR